MSDSSVTLRLSVAWVSWVYEPGVELAGVMCRAVPEAGCHDLSVYLLVYRLAGVWRQ